MARKNKEADRKYNREWYKRKVEQDPEWARSRRQFNNERIKAQYASRKETAMREHVQALAVMDNPKKVREYLDKYFKLIITKNNKWLI